MQSESSFDSCGGNGFWKRRRLIAQRVRGSSAKGYFRRRNAVSVFDYRGLSDQTFDEAWCKCGPLTAFRKCGYKIAILFVAPGAYGQLISWKEAAYDQMVVPYVECGYPAPLPVTAIDEILEISTRYYPSKLERGLTLQ